MTVVAPEGVKAEGAVKVAFVPEIADPNSPTVTELSAGVDMTLTFTAGGFTLAAEQATGEDRRFGSREVFSELGRVTYSIADATYVYDPQATAGSGGENEAYETLKPGTDGFFVLRYGLDAVNEDWAADQIVDVQAVSCGAQRKQPPPDDDEFAKLTVQQSYSTQEHYEDVTIGSAA